jgi:hypothetical protein
VNEIEMEHIVRQGHPARPSNLRLPWLNFRRSANHRYQGSSRAVDAVAMVDLSPAIVERLYRNLASAEAPQCRPARVDNTVKKIVLAAERLPARSLARE